VGRGTGRGSRRDPSLSEPHVGGTLAPALPPLQRPLTPRAPLLTSGAQPRGKPRGRGWCPGQTPWGASAVLTLWVLRVDPGVATEERPPWCPSPLPLLKWCTKCAAQGAHPCCLGRGGGRQVRGTPGACTRAACSCSWCLGFLATPRASQAGGLRPQQRGGVTVAEAGVSL